MRITYSPEADAFYLRLRDGSVDDTEEIEPGVMYDYDETGGILGVEILDFSDYLEQATQNLLADAAALNTPTIITVDMTQAARKMGQARSERKTEAARLRGLNRRKDISEIECTCDHPDRHRSTCRVYRTLKQRESRARRRA
ncbi:MAG TPA: DUF2283 domain-containing protein [Chthonomonadaceae bacterium]|nr:DUF2283 domain-containing protein [Chthonomonadaceae bacterium]